MADLATSADVAARLGRDLTPVETIKIPALLQDASASVRNYTHQYIEQVIDDTVTLRVRNARIRLPQRPVTAVSLGAGPPGSFQWLGDDKIFVGSSIPDTFGWEPWRYGIRAVTVTYTHGYNPIPDDIIGVVCSIVMRALGREPTDAGMTSESIQGYSYTIGVVGAAGALGLLNSEMAILDAYCQVGGNVQTAQPWIVG